MHHVILIIIIIITIVVVVVNIEKQILGILILDKALKQARRMRKRGGENGKHALAWSWWHGQSRLWRRWQGRWRRRRRRRRIAVSIVGGNPTAALEPAASASCRHRRVCTGATAATSSAALTLHPWLSPISTSTDSRRIVDIMCVGHVAANIFFCQRRFALAVFAVRVSAAFALKLPYVFHEWCTLATFYRPQILSSHRGVPVVLHAVLRPLATELRGNGCPSIADLLVQQHETVLFCRVPHFVSRDSRS
mmetsp:Transcript_11079/g.28065  ORF Transcript_11079/g.28065 Transcript_11079/m.28065 type:complete len:250 (+) Transcript_11079:693-1442(+)